MATIPNPLYAGFVPTNATGTTVAVPGSTSNSGQNPLIPSPGTSAQSPTSTNPLTAGFPSVPTFGANSVQGQSV